MKYVPTIRQNDNLSDYTDIMSYKPIHLTTINYEQGILINEHSKIFNALRKKNLTVKDVHKLYYNGKTGEYAKSERTVYRYIKRLEDAGIIKAGGKRITEGSRVMERVFCLFAHHYYYSEPSMEWWDSQEAITLSGNIAAFFKEIFPTKKLDHQKAVESIYELLKTNVKLDFDISKELIALKKENESIQELLSVDHPDDQRLFVIVVRLLLYVRNHDLYEKFRLIINPD